MAQFIHLFDESDAASIKRGGIRVEKTKWRKLNGVFLFPLTENFVIAHQWMRELRRRRGQALLAARIRLKDTERVLLGKYNEDHIETTAARALGIVRQHHDPMGLQVILLGNPSVDGFDKRMNRMPDKSPTIEFRPVGHDQSGNFNARSIARKRGSLRSGSRSGSVFNQRSSGTRNRQANSSESSA